jgi:NAD(P)-dependent dehydrogenase (short-subunit alcohol dehydrogenase family)
MRNDHVNLRDDVAIVTGADAGIGKAIVVTLAQAGARVVVVDAAAAQRTAAAIGAGGAAATGVGMDLSDQAGIARCFDQILAQFGMIDILVNNAGIYPFGPLHETDDATWERVMSVNVKGVLYCMRAAASRMKRGGRIVNISSIGSLRITVGGTACYDASKAAVNALTRAAADEWGPECIRVNPVLPGGVKTEGTRGTPESLVRSWIDRTSARRMGEPEDIANAVLFLVSGLADYVHGHLLVVDGGFTIR